MKKTKKRAKVKPEPTVEAIVAAKKAVVEIDISERCWHGCYSFSASRRAIWRFEDGPDLYTPRNTGPTIHNCGASEEDCIDTCWED